MGRIELVYTVICGLCEVRQPLPAIKTTDAAKRLSRDKGWECTRRHSWICPECVAKGKQKNANQEMQAV
jgi:hypothetical protein